MTFLAAAIQMTSGDEMAANIAALEPLLDSDLSLYDLDDEEEAAGELAPPMMINRA